MNRFKISGLDLKGLDLKGLKLNRNAVQSITIDSVAVFATVLLRTLSYIPLIAAVRRTQYTANIPYATLLMDLIASIIFIALAISKGYMIHLVLFLTYFTLVSYMILVKYDLDKH